MRTNDHTKNAAAKHAAETNPTVRLSRFWSLRGLVRRYASQPNTAENLTRSAMKFDVDQCMPYLPHCDHYRSYMVLPCKVELYLIATLARERVFERLDFR